MSGLSTGQQIETKSFPAITREQLKAYSQVSGDFNEIHLSDEVARKAGLTGVIAHGMILSAMLAERGESFIRNESGESGLKLSQFQTRFKAMVFPGDVITIGGTVKDAGDQGVTLDLQAKNQKGELTTTGIAKYVRKT